jgi:RNA polymerase sigma factor (sigma-70 family)
MRSAGPGARPHSETSGLEPAGAAVPRETPVLLARPRASDDSVPIGARTATPGASQVPFGVRDQPDLQSTIELTIRARAGDQVALEALCLRCLKSLTRFAAGRLPLAVRGMVETQDVVIEAVQRGMGRLHEFEVRHPGALIAYMRRILKNLIVDYVRTVVRRPRQVALDEEQADLGQSPLQRVLDEEQIALYEGALEGLKPRDAALVALKIEEQLGYEDIAVELGFPSANAARVATKRAVLRLARQMSVLSRAKGGSGAATPDRTQMRDGSS